MVDFFAKKHDKEYQAKKDKVLFDELTEMKAKRNNGKANWRDNIKGINQGW